MDRRSSPARRLRWPLLLALLFVSALASLVAVVALMSPSPPGAAPIVVEMDDLTFMPPSLTIPAGTAVSLELRNVGNLEHDWSVDALRFSPNVRPGQTEVVELVAPVGDYEVYCSLPGHREAGMVGRLEAR